MFPEPFVSRSKALPAKRSEKDYGGEDGPLPATPPNPNPPPPPPPTSTPFSLAVFRAAPQLTERLEESSLSKKKILIY